MGRDLSSVRTFGMQCGDSRLTHSLTDTLPSNRRLDFTSPRRSSHAGLSISKLPASPSTSPTSPTSSFPPTQLDPIFSLPTSANTSLRTGLGGDETSCSAVRLLGAYGRSCRRRSLHSSALEGSPGLHRGIASLPFESLVHFRFSYEYVESFSPLLTQ
jgi:hypothetical protein